MQYIYLATAIIAEVIGTSTLKFTDNFTKPLPSLVVAVCYATSFFLLSVLVKTIPVGILYAVWSGAGIVLVAIVGIVWLKQTLDLAAVIGIGLILAGVVVVNLFSRSVVH